MSGNESQIAMNLISHLVHYCVQVYGKEGQAYEGNMAFY